MTVPVTLRRLAHAGDLPLPARQSAEAAGFDLAAAVPDGQAITLAPGARALIPTGFALQLPAGTEGQVRPRSGLALKHGITVLNAPGTIDSDYRGEVKVLLVNHGQDSFTVSRGLRIAQLVITRIEPISLQEVELLDSTERGAGGFGSTGIVGVEAGR